MCSFILLTGYLYNYAPFSFKDKPVSGLIANIIMGWLAFAIGWILMAPVNTMLVVHSLPYLFFNTSLYFLTTLPDVEGDTSTKKITFPVKYGFKLTIWVSVLFIGFSVLSSLLIGDQLLLLVLILNAFFVVRLILRKDVSSAVLVIKTGIFFFCLVLSVKFPLFFLVLVFLFYLTRFYYKRRFQFDYPNFK
jgi:1,4-dihydroxy-2-naphthoate octaprenyltransferase